MKKTILAIAVIISLASCSKNKRHGICIGLGTIECTSNCTYWLPVKLESGKIESVMVDHDTWIKSLPGDDVYFK
jgi:hypothetical protein